MDWLGFGLRYEWKRKPCWWKTWWQDLAGSRGSSLSKHLFLLSHLPSQLHSHLNYFLRRVLLFRKFRKNVHVLNWVCSLRITWLKEQHSEFGLKGYSWGCLALNPTSPNTVHAWYLSGDRYLFPFHAYRRVTRCGAYATAPRSWPWNNNHKYTYICIASSGEHLF